MNKPKILIVDIETSPMEVYTFGLFDQNIGLNQIIEDWSILSWSAKWLDDPAEKIMFMSTRHQKNKRADKRIVKALRNLMDKADIIVGQNSKRFDVKKINAKIEEHELPQPSKYEQIDTMVMAKKHFGFTSNKLEYMTNKLCTKYKKLKHKKFPGFEMWSECLLNNQEAWDEMEIYNKHDVLATEELYTKLIKWGSPVNFSVYNDGDNTCSCGNTKFIKDGHAYTRTGKFQRFRCSQCRSPSRSKQNLLNKDKSKKLKLSI